MKHLVSLTIILFGFSGRVLSQPINHPTLSEVVIAHNAIPSGTTTTNSKHQIKIRPEVIIKLKPGPVSKLHLETYFGDSLLYKVAYKIDSLPIISNKIRMCYLENSVYHILVPKEYYLGKTLNYKIWSEDKNGILSEVISKSK